MFRKLGKIFVVISKEKRICEQTKFIIVWYYSIRVGNLGSGLKFERRHEF